MLAVKEVAEFRAKWPMLSTSRRVKSQLDDYVTARLRLVHTTMRRPHPEEATSLQ